MGDSIGLSFHQGTKENRSNNFRGVPMGLKNGIYVIPWLFCNGNCIIVYVTTIQTMRS